MFTFLLVVHAIISAALVAVILMQRSEGGGLGMGGSPSGLMSARGAADFLTRATTILATIFVVLSIGLAALATVRHAPRAIDDSLAPVGVPATSGLLPPNDAPTAADPLAAAAGAAQAPAAGVPATTGPTAGVPATTVPASAPKAVTPAERPKAAVPAPAVKAPATTPRSANPAPRPTNGTATIPTVTAPPPLITPPAPANGATPQ